MCCRTASRSSVAVVMLVLRTKAATDDYVVVLEVVQVFPRLLRPCPGSRRPGSPARPGRCRCRPITGRTPTWAAPLDRLYAVEGLVERGRRVDADVAAVGTEQVDEQVLVGRRRSPCCLEAGDDLVGLSPAPLRPCCVPAMAMRPSDQGSANARSRLRRR